MSELHFCVSELVREVSLLDPGWAPPFVPPPPSAPSSQPAPSPDYASDLGPEPPEACGCEESDALKARVKELETEIELRQAEHEAANTELRRRIINQAEALAVPRLEDVVEIQALKASVDELKLVISKLVPLIDPMPDDLRAVLVAAEVIDAEGGNAP